MTSSKPKPSTKKSRATPKASAPSVSGKPFTLKWGNGVIEEEAQFVTRFHRATIQLMKFSTGDAAGTYEIRFCWYDLKGRFQRSPLILAEHYLADMRKALDATPKLKRMMKKFA